MSAAVRADLLIKLDQPDAAIAVAQRGLLPVDGESSPIAIAGLFTALAEAYWRKGERAAALRNAWDAIASFPTHTALWIVREMEDRYSPDAQYFRIIVCAKPLTQDAEVFFRAVDVVASNEAEAMRFIERIEHEAVPGTLRADEIKVMEKTPDQPKGVYRVSAYVCAKDTDE